MKPPLVSVIVPAYNAARYLEAAVVSVQSQTYPHWELIIVVDGGSTDATAQVVERCARADSRIRYFHHRHERMASARNFGIKQARGDYVAFLDADNLFLPDKLKRQTAYLNNHPECGVCYSRIYHFYDQHPEVHYQNRNEIHAYRGDLFRKLLWQNFINLLAVMVRRDVFNRWGAFPEDWYACDEHYLWTNLAYRRVPFHYLESVVGLLRLHDRNDSFRNDHVFNTAVPTLTLLDMAESWFTPEERQQYGADIAALRRHWRRLRFVGRLLATPPTSWVLAPFFYWRRRRAYYPVGSRIRVAAD